MLLEEGVCYDQCILFADIAGRNFNNLRYAYDTILMAESEEELKSLLMKVKEESEKARVNLNIQKILRRSGKNTQKNYTKKA